MPDITMCQNKRCEKRSTCYRYIAKPDTVQYYFIPDPDGVECEYYIRTKVVKKKCRK
jgi:hypothetical protein